MTISRSTIVLKKGSQGSEVKRIQRLLNTWLKIPHHHYQDWSLQEDGIFGSQTESVVKFFQCRSILQIDGIVGRETLSILENGSASRPILKVGSTGSIVGRVQSVLSTYGSYRGAVDGIYGPMTRAAVTRFQHDHHIYDRNGNATGEVNAQTWAGLYKEPTAIACGPLKTFIR